MSKAPKPCMDCGVRPKRRPSHRCVWCQLRRQPVHLQAAAARKRLAMVPEGARMKRSQKIVIESTPEGYSFCAGCQSYMPVDHFGKSATQCRGCMNGKSHDRTLEDTYGIDSMEYEEILRFQGERCAICRRKPTGARRLAVDHDHQSGAVRGLLCSGDQGCNRGIGAFHDDVRMVWSAYVYLTSPPRQVMRR